MIRRRKPLARSTKPLKRGPVRKRRPGPPRRGPANISAEEWRNPKHLQFLRDEGKCVACSIEWRKAVKRGGYVTWFNGFRGDPCEPMHGPPNGRGQKGPDAGAIPGCSPHHKEQTKIGWPAFELKYGFLREREAAAWFGVFKIWESQR